MPSACYGPMGFPSSSSRRWPSDHPCLPPLLLASLVSLPSVIERGLSTWWGGCGGRGIFQSKPVLLGDCPSILLSLHTYVMYYVGCLSLSGYTIVLLRWCVLRCAPSYLRDLCCPVSVLAARRVFRSAARGELLVPRARLATVQRRAFSVVGPSAWNDLPVELHSLLMTSSSKFCISLKSFFFGRDWAGCASE